jgi:hypothetical protein
MNNTLSSQRFITEQVAVGWPWRFLVFSFLILLSSLVIYYGLAFGYRKSLQAQINGIDEDIDYLAESVPKEDQDRLLGFYSQLANLQNILNGHVLGSKIFNFLQANTNQQVFYNSMDFKINDRKLVLEGIAPSYQVFSQQLEAFSRSPDIERVVVNESYATSSSADNKIFFKIFLVLKDKVFK